MSLFWTGSPLFHPQKWCWCMLISYNPTKLDNLCEHMIHMWGFILIRVIFELFFEFVPRPQRSAPCLASGWAGSNVRSTRSWMRSPVVWGSAWVSCWDGTDHVKWKGETIWKKEETIWKNIWGSIKVDFSVEQNRYLILSVADDISEQIGKGKASKFSPNDAEWPRYHPTEDITGRNNFVLSSDLLILSLGI